jgi:peptide/nickel transport system substrate-binding protein
VTRPGRREFLATAVAVAAAMGVARRAPGQQRPRRGGALKHVGVEPSTFDIHAPRSSPAQLVSSLVRRGLFRFAGGAGHGPSDFTLVPDLAVAAVASDAGRLYTITLRRGVRWERRPPVDGRELVAEDVKYSMERALARSPYASLLGPVEGIETRGAHTVLVRLRRPCVPFLQNLAEPCNAILPREVEERLGDLSSPASLVGCGPFLLERYEPGVKAVFARNPDYYRTGFPLLDRVEWIFLKDRATRLALFRAGEIDIPSYDATVPRAEAGVTGSLRYPTARWDRLGGRVFSMRADRPPWRDVRVRRAVSLAIDRDRWMRRHLAGEGFADGGPVPPPLRQWRLGRARLGEGARYLEHDPERARRLLADAGLAVGLKARCAVRPGEDPDDLEALAMLREDLRGVGVELLVEEDDECRARGSSRARDDETAWEALPLLSEVDSYLYPLYRSGLGTNRSRVADAELDALLEAERTRAGSAARRRAIHQIERRAAAQVYYLHVPCPRSVASWTPRVRNYAPRNSLDRGAQLEVVWLDDA